MNDPRRLMSERSSNTTKIETMLILASLLIRYLSERSSNTTKIETLDRPLVLYILFLSERSSNTTKIETIMVLKLIIRQLGQKEVLTQQRLKLSDVRRIAGRSTVRKKF